MGRNESEQERVIRNETRETGILMEWSQTGTWYSYLNWTRPLRVGFSRDGHAKTPVPFPLVLVGTSPRTLRLWHSCNYSR